MENTYKVTCLVDICEPNSKEELRTYYVKSEDGKDVEQKLKERIISCGWSVSDINVIGKI